jgi:phospholipid/cholesterol/gamma-HCH transport system permease protein
MGDIYSGLIKAAFFGFILTSVGCYMGFYAKGGAEGVGHSTTVAVVVSYVTILVGDFVLTAIMF